ncbi:hypothetical protein [Luteolibacter sp. LG18]|uniref:hypothetical protein n=1 Tax=Luteolibacter sp. LG18 TaxID=2819286 RepID=UPI0030C74067
MIRIFLTADRSELEAVPALLASVMRRTAVPVQVRIGCFDFAPPSFRARHLAVDFVSLPASGFSAASRGTDGWAILDRLTSDWESFLFINGPLLVFGDLAEILHRSAPAGSETGEAGEGEGEALPPEPGAWWVSRASTRCLAPLRGMVPCGGPPTAGFSDSLVHWKKGDRPWKRNGGGAPSAGLWASEKVSWECLRMGQWEKPLVLEIEPGNLARAIDLAERGWKVLVEDRDGVLQKVAPALPDLKVVPEIPPEHGDAGGPPSFVRFGSSPDTAETPGLLEGGAPWLVHRHWRPRHILLGGPVSAREVRGLIASGYTRAAILPRNTWQPGGQDPGTLDYRDIELPDDAESADETSFVEKGWDAFFVHDGTPLPVERPTHLTGVPIVRRAKEEALAEDGVPPDRRLSALAAAWRRDLDHSGRVGETVRPINIVLHGDPMLMIPLAVTIHSIVRRTLHPVHVRCYFRGEPPADFHAANLLVEFIAVRPARIAEGLPSYDGLEILRDHPQEWDRCWLMDSDHLMTADPAAVYFDDMRGCQVMASTVGIKLGTCWDIRDPSREHEIFSNCPILNLIETGHADTWSRIDELRRVQRVNGHHSLVSVAGGSLRVLPDRWGRAVYVNDIDRDYTALLPGVVRPEKDWFENYGVLSYSYGPKPWTAGASFPSDPRVRERIWFKEYSTWEKLRDGDWCHPDGCSILPWRRSPAAAPLHSGPPVIPDHRSLT